MKTTEQFLSELDNLNIKLWVDDDRLRCNAPKGKLSPELKAELTERKAEILELIRNINQLNNIQEPIPQVSRENNLPLSFAQERLWFLDQFEADSPLYNLPKVFRIKGILNVEALRQSLNKIIQRHEALRTSFTSEGQPVQVITASLTITLPIVDLQDLPEIEQKTEVKKLIDSEIQELFNLTQVPLLRTTLLRLSKVEHIVMFTIHHIVFDGWSMEILMRELKIFYEAFCLNQNSSLSELPIQYADFAVWQRQWLSEEVMENQLNYWREQLHDVPELLQLPTDHPRPSVQTYQGNTQNFTLNTDLTHWLQTLSRKSGTTLFMILQGAFATLLYRYSGQSDILIGSPIANRNRQEIESLIGFFVNTLVLRTRFEDNPSFESLLKQVRETTLKAYEHQDVPFEQVVEALQPQRSLSYAPLFQVMFVLQNTPMSELELPGVTLSELDLQSTVSKFDLTLLITETNRGLVCEWEYNTHLFNGSTIKRMAANFQNLLFAIVENPQRTVENLSLLSEAECHQLLVEWNDTITEYPTDKCIHQLFEEQVERTPDAVAIVFDKEQLTYKQLNQRANQLSHYLKDLGVGPEVLVGICVERSIEMVVGLLGIFKAGGAYVPLDPNYPQERLSYMLTDSSVEVLLTEQSLLEFLPEHQAQVIALDSDWNIFSQEREASFMSNNVTPENLAYVIYTSGSTGQPKGAMVEHRGMLNHIYAKIYTLSLKDTNRVAQTAPITFDISVWQIMSVLLVGGQVHIFNDQVVRNPARLLEELESQKISVLEIVPSLLRIILEEIDSNSQEEYSLSNLHWLVLTGEALPPSLCNQWLAFYPKVPILNAYGPTECSDDVAHYSIYGHKQLAA